MRAIAPQPSLVDRVVEAIVGDIVAGELPANSRLIQEDLARIYGVSRQPVQQALLLLRNQGLVREAGGRGLVVSPVDPAFVNNLYEVRAVLDGLAARRAAQNGAARAKREGPALVAAGRAAVKSRSLPDQISADIAFHALIDELACNPLIGETTAPHWPYVRRVMGEVLRGDEQMPKRIWDEHAAILDAVIKGDGDRAEALAKQHISGAAAFMVERLEARQEVARQDRNRRRITSAADL
ncbi:MAG: GntR family transcriptional regulator [Hyphomicrobiales bacterium]|nr:GntR family transcriptional regulator [Rhodoblastus sp.]MCC2112903.1 GntR family transcriptional regulator [Hyphomicrobiales bacterium]